MRPARRPARRQAGFTLLEMLAVMVIVALAAGAAVFHARSKPGGRDAKAAAHRIAAVMRAARNSAINDQSEHVVLIDAARRIVQSGAAHRALPIPAGIGVSVIAADGERRGGAIAGVRFFPNGSSTGASIRLIGNRQAYEVRINWLTGRVSIARPP